MKNILILGCTGSVGESTLRVIEENRDSFKLIGMSFHNDSARAIEIIQEHSPDFVYTNIEDSKNALKDTLKTSFEILSGSSDLEKLLNINNVDIIVSAISGFAGLEASILAAKTGKRILLANKESIVAAGDLLMPLAKEFKTQIIPIDSEHNAIHQCLLSCTDSNDISNIVITASGGPFLNHSLNELSSVSIKEALAHPNWSMGSKISIDSATLVNKCLELIEAKYLFNLDESKFSLIVHPQSIIHSVVTFTDGSSISQMSNPDMRVPIANALAYNRKVPFQFKPLDFSGLKLEFLPFPEDRIFLEEMARAVCNEGGLTGTIFNAANEVAVASFLNQEIKFSDIYSVIKRTFDTNFVSKDIDLESIYEKDKETRIQAKKVIESLS
jgi:1-deoxy-D-xylulose-5-phosphate reductoisomerase